MNVKTPTDYSTTFTTLDELMAKNLPQMELVPQPLAAWSAAGRGKSRL